jgi:SAM-dependent methyltransferase
MTSDTISKQAQFQKLMGYVAGNQAAWIANIGVISGMFRAIAEAGVSGITEEALAHRLDYAPRYVQVWCRAAYAFELLDWDASSAYRLAPHMDALLLDAADPQFMAGRIQMYTAFYEDYIAFPKYLKTGAIWPRSDHDPLILTALKNLTKPDSVAITDHVLPQAADAASRLAAGGRLLDIGAGAGFHLLHYARRFPEAELIGLELDEPSVALARQAIAEANAGERVSIQHGDANRLEYENWFDVVTMNIALHETGGPAEHRNVLKRVCRALKPGGTLIVSELPYPDSPEAYRENPVYKMLAGVQLHEAIVGCGMITQGELRALLDEAQFVNTRAATYPMPTRFVMLGEKPG